MPTPPADDPERLQAVKPGPLQRLTFLFRTYAAPPDALPASGPYLRDDRNCFTLRLPREWTSDSNGGSPVVLYEDGQPLGPAHVSHDDIRTLGAGRYSHWSSTLFFSSSDNTDPNTNGRSYAVLPPAGWTGTLPPPPRGDVAPRASLPASHAVVLPGMAALPSRLRWTLHEARPGSLVAIDGHAWRFPVPAAWPSDADNLSTTVLLEDGVPLPRPHAPHVEIVAAGEGRYSHWDGSMIFSASDNSDPRRNGRRYVAAFSEALIFAHAPQPPQREQGHCFILATMPRHWVSDDRGGSRVVLLEDDTPLGPAHCQHADIRDLGGGRYSHWQGMLLFSASDNSDVLQNGRHYTAALAP